MARHYCWCWWCNEALFSEILLLSVSVSPVDMTVSNRCGEDACRIMVIIMEAYPLGYVKWLTHWGMSSGLPTGLCRGLLSSLRKVMFNQDDCDKSGGFLSVILYLTGLNYYGLLKGF